jgi:hypothetical protein
MSPARTRTPTGSEVSAPAQLVLMAISTRERRYAHVARLADLAERVRVDDLARYIVGQRLTLVVSARLAQLGLSDLAQALDERLAPRREQVRDEATVQAVLTDSIVKRLEAVGIAALTVKGVNLARRLYGDYAGRESGDIDILVSAEHLGHASVIAQQQFLYAPPVDALARNRLPLLHYRLRHPTGLPNLELHWRVHWFESTSGAAMLRRSTVADGVREMNLTDELASLLLFYARDGFVGLRNLAAIAAWWDCHGADLPGTGLAAFASEFPQLLPALATSARVAAELAGLPLKPLRLSVSPSRRERRAARLANPEPRQAPNRLQADVALVDLLLAPTLDFRGFVRRQMLLNTSYNDAQSAAAGRMPRRERRLIIEGVISRAGRMLIGLVQTRGRGLELDS